jgi:hypothetical protein
MVAIRRLLVVAVCSVLCASAPVRADDKRPTEPKRLAVFALTAIDADEAVGALKKKLGYTEIARIPLSNAVLAWGTDQELLEIVRLITPL